MQQHARIERLRERERERQRERERERERAARGPLLASVLTEAAVAAASTVIYTHVGLVGSQGRRATKA
jgi:hypothetical protein